MKFDNKTILTVAIVGVAAYLLYQNRGKLFAKKMSSTSSFAANEDMFISASGGCGCGCGCPKGCQCEKCRSKNND